VSGKPDADIRCLRLVTWNIARRSSRIVEQATALASREPDVVALQEVTRRTTPVWRSLCFHGPCPRAGIAERRGPSADVGRPAYDGGECVLRERRSSTLAKLVTCRG
jgi:hypothetical protein